MSALEKPIEWVDTERVIAHVMPLLFQTGWPVIAELVQNAQRAGSTRIKIVRDPANQMLSIEDDGEGIAHSTGLIFMLRVGQTGFTAPDVWQQHPAGMGLYALLSSAKLVEIASGFGAVTVESNRWFAEPEYRQELLGRVNEVGRRDCGLKITALGINGTLCNIADEKIEGRLSGYRNMQIEYNGKIIKYYDPAEHYAHFVDLEGARVWWHLRPGGWHAPLNGIGSEEYYATTWVSWFGHLIPASLSYGYKMFVEVDRACSFHPKLPDRDAIIDDTAWTRFKEKACSKICQSICAMHMAELIKKPPLVEMAWQMDREYFRAHSPVGLFQRVVGAEDDPDGVRYRDTPVVIDAETPVRTIGGGVDVLCGKILVQEGMKLPFTQFDSGHNAHIIGLLAEAGEEFLIAQCVPEAMKLIQPEDVAIELEGVDLRFEKQGVVWAKKGTMVIRYDDGQESRHDLDGQLIMDDEYMWIWDFSVVVIGADPVKVLGENQAWLFFFSIDQEDGYETQKERFDEELEAIVDEMTGTIPMLEKLREACLGDPKDISTIRLDFADGEQPVAIVAYSDGKPDKAFKVR